MRPDRAAFTALLAILAAAGCAPRDDTWTTRFPAFGTLVEIDIYGADDDASARAAADVEAYFHAAHAAWHPRGAGALGRVNRALADGGVASVGADLAALLADASALSRESGGLFDPTLGRLVELWGFSDDERTPTAPPDPRRVRAILAEGIGPERLVIGDGAVRSTSRAVALDLGGFAKGVAVDRAVERLRALGVSNAIVNAGGDLKVIGRRGNRPWRIGIRHPRGAGVMAAIEVADGECVFTSGDYERYFERGGRRYHHILDPRTGEPAGGAVSVTVLGKDATRADAAATALFVAGAGAWREVARRLGVEHVMLVAPDGRIEMSPAMTARLTLEDASGGAARIELQP